MKALICGVNGQDGSYLAKFLLKKGYEVWGTSRDVQASSLNNLERLGIKDSVKLVSMAPGDFRSVFTAMDKSEPDEVYYLSGQSSVGLSFEQPAETLESIVSGTLNVLEVLRLRHRDTRLYHAGSSECFGDTDGLPADESTPFKPRSPYAVAKASAHWLVANYRESYSLHASTGVLFNHESPLRPKRFVTQKIIDSAKKIASGEMDKLVLGRLDIQRDWGWAPEYIDAMWRMLQLETPEDLVIATGQTHSLEEFVAEAFAINGLNWEKYVEISQEFYRPTDILYSGGNPAKAQQLLNWNAKTKMADVVRLMSE
ncbi:GDP-mannose 4,6-dehydratase [Paraglaciecola sp. MB-3u-78]|uniref:GDP-mannose 4,6-dehydratase n=1 Tax=Paraglaciecola sp. MB-3u-78 TaxID=2058332 RepID=UPI000C34590B|nr:GDP-mannose 4,6-dehydratase [Paraglaciecola sp. MB-3u-78]PKG98951.1 GDP-mannose 4,6-dehydratase [Paraglaciecola sp. MB-3u-78]